jgi:hypothetical protein
MDTRLFRRPIMRTIPLLFTLTVLASTPAIAQPLNPGSTVRLQAGPITGEFTVLEATSELLVVRSRHQSAEYSIPMDAVRRLDLLVEIPRSERVRRGARGGLIAGSTIGVLAGFGVGAALQGDPMFDVSTASILAGAAMFGAVGGLVGLGVGSIAGHNAPTEHWQRVPLAGGVAVHTDLRTLSLGYSMAF